MKPMITQDEYIKAIDVINQYQKELNNTIIKISKKGLTELKLWKCYRICSVRLRNILVVHMIEGRYYSAETSEYISIPPIEKYIELVDLKKLKRERNCGNRSLKEFKELRGY